MTKKQTKPAMATPTGKIEITVQQFYGIRDLSSPNRFCISADPVIADSAGGRVYIVNGDPRTIRIDNGNHGQSPGKPIKLEFTILPAGSYLVEDVLFDAYGLFDNPSNGKKACWKILSIKDNVVTVMNNYTVGPELWEPLIA